MLESTFKAKQRKHFQAKGWMFIQNVAGAGVPEGWPDTLCLAPNGYSCHVEWKKSKDAEHQPLQDYWNKWLNDRGHDAFFIYPENVEEWRQEMLRKGKK